MKFGTSYKNRFSGAWLSVRLFQAVSILPAVFFFVASGYRGILYEKGILSFLFSLGFCSLPSGETMGLSALYRLTGSEILIHFILLGFALFAGLLLDRFLRASDKTGRVLRVVLISLCAVDLPLSFILPLRGAFGWPAVVCGAAFRLCLIGLIVADFIAARKEKNERENTKTADHKETVS